MEDWQRKSLERQIERLEERVERVERRSNERIDPIPDLMVFLPPWMFAVFLLVLAIAEASEGP